ncbi:DUF1566 domain-containing protein [Caldichromatium japonicum]|uniref:DUF1566 domain-containing protein n=2 Tax=Caldichromatium japonicum TaxID=2699430 RepID=A0A6G7VGG9_9GAMM|nr:DUF1566 domain-containing protein [Caldichromatium japonicum]
MLLNGGLIRAQECTEGTGAPIPDPRYLPLQDGTVYDGHTGLMWKQCPEGTGGIGCAMGEALRLRFKDADALAHESRFAGHADWRLPTRVELRSLLRRGCYGMVIDSVTFPRTPPGRFWTADPAGFYPDSAWTLDFRTGHLGYGMPRDLGYIRLVRDAPGCTPGRPATCLPYPDREAEPHDRTEGEGDGASVETPASPLRSLDVK